MNVMFGASGETRTLTPLGIRPSNVRVYQFHHARNKFKEPKYLAKLPHPVNQPNPKKVTVTFLGNGALKSLVLGDINHAMQRLCHNEGRSWMDPPLCQGSVAHGCTKTHRAQEGARKNVRSPQKRAELELS